MTSDAGDRCPAAVGARDDGGGACDRVARRGVLDGRVGAGRASGRVRRDDQLEQELLSAVSRCRTGRGRSLPAATSRSPDGPPGRRSRAPSASTASVVVSEEGSPWTSAAAERPAAPHLEVADPWLDALTRAAKRAPVDGPAPKGPRAMGRERADPDGVVAVGPDPAQVEPADVDEAFPAARSAASSSGSASARPRAPSRPDRRVRGSRRRPTRRGGSRTRRGSRTPARARLIACEGRRRRSAGSRCSG